MAGQFGLVRAGKRVALAGCLAALVLTATAGASGDTSWNFKRDGLPNTPGFAAMKAPLALMAGEGSIEIARQLGMEELDGKKLDNPPPARSLSGGSSSSSGTVSDQPNRSAHNVAIRDFPNVSENEPTVAANPKNSDRVVAGSHFIGDTANRCVAHYSRDGGQTWSARPIFMPQLTHQSQCSDPVLAYTPDGSRVYYAYIDIKSSFTFEDPVITLREDLDILVSYSDDDGKTWHGPIVAMNGSEIVDQFNLDTGEETLTPGFEYDKPWINTHVAGGGGGSNWAYVTATAFEVNFSDTVADQCRIDFARSSNKGMTWSAPTTLDSSVTTCGDPIVVQGSRPAGGQGRDVVAAWYHSNADGFRNGTFSIRTRYSADNGATFAPVNVAANDSFELQTFLGPAFAYHRWWGGMFPDVEIAADGSGHIAYIHDPVAGSDNEDGNVRYVRSPAKPYTTWSAPLTVNDDSSGKAQGWAAIDTTTKGEDGKVTVYALWEDHRLSSRDNFEYDVFTSKKVGNGAWSTNKRLTDEKSRSDFLFLGDYFDITAVQGLVYGVWTDRRDEPTEFDLDDDVWGASLKSVGGDDD